MSKAQQKKYYKTTGWKAEQFLRKTMKDTLFKEQHNTCAYCGKEFAFANLTLDHITPLSKGGKTRKNNLVLCCKECNQKKSDKAILECKEIITNPNIPNKILLQMVRMENEIKSKRS